MKAFDPNAPAEFDGLFGLPHSLKESRLAVIPVPWEATTSYGGGTSKAPNAVLQASYQVDLFDAELGPFYEKGIHLLKESPEFKTWNIKAKKRTPQVINPLSREVNKLVYETTQKLMGQNLRVGVLGGDHSVPFGSISAHAEKFKDLGLLHFDAHCDLRKAYEGFEDSHASIMFNVLEKTKIKKLVQVGIRDFCKEEIDYAKSQGDRVKIFFDSSLQERKFSGEPWKKITESVASELPDKVYVSFDIDGLDPKLCPHTGTPVPGGLNFAEAMYIIKAVAKSGRQIVGFDLNEVAPDPKGDEWDANVGARVLFKLCGWTLFSST